MSENTYDGYEAIEAAEEEEGSTTLETLIAQDVRQPLNLSASQALAARQAQRTALNTRQPSPQEAKNAPLDQSAYSDEFTRYSQTQAAAHMGYWVEVPLGAYKGMRVLYRTNNRNKVQAKRPFFRVTGEIKDIDRQKEALERKVILARAQITAGRDDAPSTEQMYEWEDKIDELRYASLDKQEAALSQFRRREAEWLALYVLDIDPWHFNDIAEKPSAGEPQSFHVLPDELADLYEWMKNEGYQLALQKSAKNY